MFEYLGNVGRILVTQSCTQLPDRLSDCLCDYSHCLVFSEFIVCLSHTAFTTNFLAVPHCLYRPIWMQCDFITNPGMVRTFQVLCAHTGYILAFAPDVLVKSRDYGKKVN